MLALGSDGVLGIMNALRSRFCFLVVGHLRSVSFESTYSRRLLSKSRTDILLALWPPLYSREPQSKSL